MTLQSLNAEQVGSALFHCRGSLVAKHCGVCCAGMMAVAVTPNMKLAAVCSAYFYSLFNLFAGFTITQPNMPGWWYASPHASLPIAEYLHRVWTVAHGQQCHKLLCYVTCQQPNACCFISGTCMCLTTEMFDTLAKLRLHCLPCRIWFSYINPIFWTVYGLIITQVGNLDTPCTLADGTVQPVYQAVLTIFGYQ